MASRNKACVCYTSKVAVCNRVLKNVCVGAVGEANSCAYARLRPTQAAARYHTLLPGAQPGTRALERTCAE